MARNWTDVRAEARAIGQFTVRAYVGALGGEVEIVAKFGDERFTIG
jgi:hypothetical protein